MYNSLDQSKHQVRLLRLLPGHGSESVHCELFIMSLDEPSEFEALSYVWGSEEDPVQIVLGGQVKSVTRNLGSALHHLRNDEKERVLWVDAVCINQDDLDERSSQVQLMQRVYSGASQVVVWLGPLKRQDERIIKVIGRLGNDPLLHWTAIQNMDDKLPGLYMFLRHQWWSRIWTAQEAILAKQITYYRGNIHISSHDLIGMAASFREHVHTNRCCQTLRLPRNGVDMVRDIARIMDNILLLHRFSLRTHNADFDEVALLFRHRQATNPLDMVYGLLGISCGIKESSINYKFSKAEVYELATRDSISHNNNLNILSHISRGEAGASLFSDYFVRWPEDTPSWVPDLTTMSEEARLNTEVMRYKAPFLNLYNACGTLTYKSTKDDPVGKLHLAGVCCDTIEKISKSTVGRTLQSETDVIKDWRDMAGMEKDPGKAYVGGDTVSEAFWRTLCLDVYASAAIGEGQARSIRRAGAKERDAHLMYWYMWMSNQEEVYFQSREAKLVKRTFEFLNHVSKVITRRRFFISRKGYMGLAPLGVEVDDHICVLAYKC
ncbi:putative heterokaryon incompatibility protein [Rosellinia necatrix]|uniref:Putative heterokaryon incompatibility protein n=1 Tax=Rosellinia necatrix TaxID=77044 RepID=A0A1W2TGM0_ROSNE|nr:putative heterokaryon incompatibility protein [Rosellinia necatrix]